MHASLIKKSIQLTVQPFDDIIVEGGGYDFRLNQESWAELQSGDVIEFWEDFSGWDKGPTIAARRIFVEIKTITHAANFADLIDLLPSVCLRDKSKEILLKNLHQWWSWEEQIHNGVIAMNVKLITKN